MTESYATLCYPFPLEGWFRKVTIFMDYLYSEFRISMVAFLYYKAG